MKKSKKLPEHTRKQQKEATAIPSILERRWNPRIAILLTVGAVAAVFAAVLFVGHRMETSETTSIPTAHPPVVLTRRWVNREPIPERLFQDSMEQLSRELDRAATAIPPPPAQAPITDRRFFAQLAEAQRIVAGMTSIPGAWAWEDVRAEVAHIGVTTDVYQGEGDHWSQGARRFEHEFGSNTYSSHPNAIIGFDPLRLARLLIHEATHAVYDRHLLAYGGYTRTQMLALLSRCPDMTFAFLFLTESLAHWNEAAFQVQHPHAHQGEGNHPILLEQALAAFHGNTLGTRRFSNVMAQYAMHHLPRPWDGQASCGPPPILSGPHRGQRLFFPEVGNEILAPIYNALVER